MAVARRDEFLFTSESVTEGQPDKVADQISDAVLDAVMREDPAGRVACRTLVTRGLVVVAGELEAQARVDVQDVARETIARIGYRDPALGFSAGSCAVVSALRRRSPVAARRAAGVPEADPAVAGMAFGYATDETPELMPLPIALAHRLARRLAAVRRSRDLPYLRPDGKCQVTVRYVDGRPVEVVTVVVAAQHDDEVDPDALIRPDIWEHVVAPALPDDLYDPAELNTPARLLVNPTGRFVLGGPAADCGLTGRKVMVDTYGGMVRHGGGAFSGQDPSRTGRVAAYGARHVAKNVVAAGLAERCEVQIALAAGAAGPPRVTVETFGTERVEATRIAALIGEHFDLRPGAIGTALRLRRPIFAGTAVYGHFGRAERDFTWERPDRAPALRAAAGLDAGAPAHAALEHA